jgi:DNA (cytosine-5)-methyltransferase 1
MIYDISEKSQMEMRLPEASKGGRTDGDRPWSVFCESKSDLVRIRRPFKMISLFSGCGGLDLGMMAAGFNVLWSNDLNKDACETYRHNLGETVQGDITTLGFPKDIPKGIDLLTAGFPCQAYSNAGLRKGLSDSRGNLFRTALEAVEKFKPSIVLFENVRGLLSVKAEGGFLVKIICDLLDELGYTAYFKLVDASQHRVAQRRLRLIFVAVKRSFSSGPFLFPEAKEKDGLTIKDTIFGVPASAANYGEVKILNPQAVELASRIPEGGCWRDVPYEFLPLRLQKVWDNIDRYRWPRFYARYARTAIAGTITAEFKPENACVWHPTRHRAMTVREVARIQSFPDWFEFKGSILQSKYRQLGNAVPPRLAYEIGLSIAQLLKNPEPKRSTLEFLSYDSFSGLTRPFRPTDPCVVTGLHPSRQSIHFKEVTPKR